MKASNTLIFKCNSEIVGGNRCKQECEDCSKTKASGSNYLVDFVKETFNINL